jgi:hypothetical protein
VFTTAAALDAKREAAYLRSLRTTTQEDVDRKTAAHDRWANEFPAPSDLHLTYPDWK